MSMTAEPAAATGISSGSPMDWAAVANGDRAALLAVLRPPHFPPVLPPFFDGGNKRGGNLAPLTADELAALHQRAATRGYAAPRPR